MINREDWNGKKYEEMAAAMEADLVLYKERLSEFADLDACNAEEQVLMASMDEVQDRLQKVEYDLPVDVTYNGKRYTRKDVASKVIYFLNKLEVKFEQTLGLYQLVNIWKTESLEKISYAVYDSTLRCLNQVPYKGYNEWSDILAANEFLSQCHNEYSLDTGMLVYLSACHNALMNRMKELDPDSEVPADMS